MATAEEHYKDVLSDVYSWLQGGYESQLAGNREFFDKRQIRPSGSATAVDLGAGCGFQSIPLAELGYAVTAIDMDEHLLRELAENDSTGKVSTVQDDMMNFPAHMRGKAELFVSMTDSILHLDASDKVSTLVRIVYEHLEDAGKFIITFRDMSELIADLDRFIPVRQDPSRIFTCFLEYETDTVKIHDLVYTHQDGNWIFEKSFFRKLRLSEDWVREQLVVAGFTNVTTEFDSGFVVVVAQK